MKLKEKLQEIVGKSVSDNIEDTRTASRDASPVVGTTDLVVWPNDIEKLRKVIRLSALRGYPLTVRGSGTGTAGGSTPSNSTVIDMSHFNRILELDRNEKSVIVEAGVIVGHLNKILKKVGLWFPVHPYDADVLHIGSLVARNGRSRHSYKYGPVSDSIMWIEFIDGTGKVIQTENVQNVSGMEGQTGAIVSVKLKLTHLKITSTKVYEFKNAEDLLEKIKELKKENKIIAIEYVDKICAKALDWPEVHHLLVEKIDEKESSNDIWQIYNTLIPKFKDKRFLYEADPEPRDLEEYLRFTRKAKIPTLGSIGSNKLTSLFKLNDENIAKMYQISRRITCGNGFGKLKPVRDIEFRKEIKRKFDPSGIFK